MSTGHDRSGDQPIAESPGPRRRGALHGAAVEQLRRKIVTGDLPPNTRLKEADLCAQLGVSRTPIREAFRTLAAEGLVKLLPNHSVVVASLDPDGIEDLYIVFGTLEGLAGELACTRIKFCEIAEIGGLLNEMFALHEGHQRGPYMQINHQIHRRVVEIAANPVITSIWQSLVPRVERARALANLDRNRWTAALYEHSKMFVALAARDGPLLARLTREHFLNGLPPRPFRTRGDD